MLNYKSWIPFYYCCTNRCNSGTIQISLNGWAIRSLPPIINWIRILIHSDRFPFNFMIFSSARWAQPIIIAGMCFKFSRHIVKRNQIENCWNTSCTAGTYMIWWQWNQSETWKKVFTGCIVLLLCQHQCKAYQLNKMNSDRFFQFHDSIIRWLITIIQAVSVHLFKIYLSNRRIRNNFECSL